MRTIPVGETISGAYEFAFAGFLSVLGIAWFPHVLFVVFAAAVVLGLAPDLPGQIVRGEFNTVVFFEIQRIAGLIWLGGIIMQSMVTVGLQKKALGKIQGPTYFYFSLGRPVWRMIGAIFLAVLTLILLALATAVATALVAFLAIHLVPHFGKAIAAVAIIAAVLWYVYAIVRLMFFLPAVVVAEEQIGLVKAWECGSGNFWRIVAVLLVVFVPVAIGFGIVQAALVGPFMPTDLVAHLRPGMSPDELGEFYQAIFKSMMQQMRAALPVIALLGLIRSVIFLGLGNGAVAKAYLAVTAAGPAQSA